MADIIPTANTAHSHDHGTGDHAGCAAPGQDTASSAKPGKGGTEEHGAGSHKHGAGGHGHHGDLRQQSRSAMLTVLAMTSTYMIVEVVVGFMSHSLALLADAGHMLSDVGALVLALVAFWFSAKPPTPDKTYGYYRSEILAGFFNSLLLVGISLYILLEAYQRIQHPPEVGGLPVLIVAAFGFVINLTSLKLLHKGSQNSINAKAAYLEVMSDSLATLGVIISSIIIMTTHWYAADAVISAVIGVAILPRTWLLLTECINILMEGTPGHINLAELRQSIISVDGVVDVHDIHVWTITSGLDSMSGHVTIDPAVAPDAVLAAVTDLLNDKYGLNHTTIQVDQGNCKDTNSCKA
ncbi:MAG TPA: cation diffusion facilitator family transporter [Trichormus sp.]